MISDLVNFVVDLVGDMGYFGIFIMMFFESSLVPIPSEVAMIPGGMLAARGEMNFFMVFLVGTIGNVLGAIFNYFFAHSVGRKFLLNYGQYFFITDKAVYKMEKFFRNHGEISTFTARLIPGLRHYISLQAGISNMDLKKFIAYTAAGAGLWTVVLTVLGYVVGENEELVHEYLNQITITVLIAMSVMLIGYVWWKKRNKQPSSDSDKQSSETEATEVEI